MKQIPVLVTIVFLGLMAGATASSAGAGAGLPQLTLEPYREHGTYRLKVVVSNVGDGPICLRDNALGQNKVVLEYRGRRIGVDADRRYEGRPPYGCQEIIEPGALTVATFNLSDLFKTVRLSGAKACYTLRWQSSREPERSAPRAIKEACVLLP